MLGYLKIITLQEINRALRSMAFATLLQQKKMATVIGLNA
jgi:hypothetical protein